VIRLIIFVMLAYYFEIKLEFVQNKYETIYLANSFNFINYISSY